MRYVVPIILLLGLGLSSQLSAFCGLYVAKNSSQLYNQSSQIVYVREGNQNIITMTSDYQGDINDFAMIVPVPTLLERNQIQTINKSVIDRLDQYSAPRLVEYNDPNPCHVKKRYPLGTPQRIINPITQYNKAKKLGITIEAKYAIHEYDILLLSAKESRGLVQWLNDEGYQLPQGAEKIIGSYLKQDMKFFVAKVNLPKFKHKTYTQLHPIQISYISKRFMLPIRLGALNAKGKQELLVYALTRKGQVRATNYRTVKIPTDIKLPPYIKEKNLFKKFYKTMFNKQAKKHKDKAIFLEYAWNMSWCAPCATDPLSNTELKKLGVFWLDPNTQSASKEVYISRLHLRYSKKSFPEDLIFQSTSNQTNFQARYAVHHPYTGTGQCHAGDKYFNNRLPERFSEEAKHLNKLTHWDLKSIRSQQVIPKHINYTEGDDWLESIWE